MLRSAEDIIGYSVRATDGELGQVEDFYFDDGEWKVRYVIVDAGSWLSSRLVMIAPVEVGQPDWAERDLPVSLTRRQVEESPVVSDQARPTREHEVALAGYYGWSPWWNTMPTGPLIPMRVPETPGGDTEAEAHEPDLRSVRELRGYAIEARDGSIGHLADIILDTEDWQVRYVVADTGKWLPGRRVLLARAWIESVSWEDAAVHVGLTRQEVKDSPEYDPRAPVNRAYEVRLYDYYGRPKYW